jgi:endo-beta-N-acetylglucosaminidase D
MKTRLSKCIAVAACLAAGNPAVQAQYDFIPKAPAFDPAEILGWSPQTDPDAPRNKSSVPLAERFTAPKASENPDLHALWNVNANARPGEAKVQAVTTFNTIPAAGTHGWRTIYVYAPTIWQYTDSLVQWGTSDRNTKVILVPAAHMIDAAHRNGVKIYGKIFFNWNAAPDPVSLQKIRDLLVKSGNTFPVADKLVEAAKYYGFDGWFINQENYQTTPTDAQNMLDFLAYFRTKAALEGAPHLKITWYDAMAEDGSRAFQNAYTTANDSYLKKDDGTLTAHNMFLNFWWYNDPTRLANSRAHALSRGIDPYAIHAGIWTENNRVLGNTPDENGGGNIPIPWDDLFPQGQPHVHSLALYGSETPFFKGRQPSASAAQDTLYWSGPNSDPADTTTGGNWKGIAHYIPASSVIHTLPFITHFNTGHGTHYRINGETRMSGAWTNLSLQDILPTWQWTVYTPAGGKTITPAYDFTNAYRGGSSLKVSGSLSPGNPQIIKLYQTRLTVDAGTSLKLTSRSTTGEGKIDLAYSFEDDPFTIHYSSPAALQTGWTERVVPLGAHAGRTIAMLGVRLSTDITVSAFTANIGKIEVSSGSPVEPSVPMNLIVEGKATNPDEATATMLRLKWTPSQDPVLHYNVWYQRTLDPGAKRQWLGASPIPWFFAQDVRRTGVESSGFLTVDAVSPSGGISSESVPVPFAFEPLPNLHHPVIASYPPAAPITVIASSAHSSRNNAFDNNPSTHSEPGGENGAWVGLDLGEGNAKRIVAIRFVPRNNWVNRAINGVFQGSNTADFSSGVEQLAKIEAPPPEGEETTFKVDNPTEFRYLRYLSPPGGYANIAEIKFYADGVAIAPSSPIHLQGTMTGETANLTWSAPATGYVTSYSVHRSASPDGPYFKIAEDLNGTTYSDAGLAAGATYSYLIKANNEIGESIPSARLTLNPSASEKLSGGILSSGTPFGSNVPSNAFDAKLTTYFESTSSQSWVGLDLGSSNSRVIHSIRYSPRNSNPTAQTNANFMLGGRFQVANSADFSDAVTLITIPTAPAYNILTSVAVTPSTMPWRYVRYITASGRNANISEFEIYGKEDPYSSWLALRGVNASDQDSGFDADLDGDGIPNGVEFMNPGGLTASLNNGSSNVTAEIRNDIMTETTLWISNDLVQWSQVPYNHAADQSGLTSGFSRVSHSEPLAPTDTKKFYRFRFSR